MVERAGLSLNLMRRHALESDRRRSKSPPRINAKKQKIEKAKASFQLTHGEDGGSRSTKSLKQRLSQANEAYENAAIADFELGIESDLQSHLKEARLVIKDSLMKIEQIQQLGPKSAFDGSPYLKNLFVGGLNAAIEKERELMNKANNAFEEADSARMEAAGVESRAAQSRASLQSKIDELNNGDN